MNPTLYDLNSSVAGTIPMSEAIRENNSNQPLILTNDIDLIYEEKHLLSNQDNPISNLIDNVPLESSIPSQINKKQKSLISVYDNSNDGEQQTQIREVINRNNFPLVGILGNNQRSQSFTKRLLLSGFPKPLLCDINSNKIDSNYVSYETFFQQCPSIILITENLPANFENSFPLNQQQLLVDVREINSSNYSLIIPNCYQAFGNLSNLEIENGTQRTSVAVEQSSPVTLIKFISNLNCFYRGITFLDQYTYNNIQIKSFRNCLFPLLSTIIIFSLAFIISMIEYRYNNHKDSYHTDTIYRQASSITGTTSLTLLSLLYLIRPIVELSELTIKKLFQKKSEEKLFLINSKVFKYWLESRRYLSWYSLSFALLHLLFIILMKNDFNQKNLFYPILFGIITLIFLTVLSFVYFPWISERLLWREYHLLTSYLGPFVLLIAFIHVFIHWKYDYYYYTKQQNLFQLKFFSMILPLIVLILRFIMYGLIHPIKKILQNHQRITKATRTTDQTKKDTSLLP